MQREGEQEETRIKISPVRTHQKEESLTFFWIERKTLMLRRSFQSNQGFYVISAEVDAKKNEDQMAGCQHKERSYWSKVEQE